MTYKTHLTLQELKECIENECCEPPVLEKNQVLELINRLNKLEEKQMTPVPHGVISTSEGPVDPSEVELAEAVLAVEDDEKLVELVEEVLPEAEDGVLKEEE